jgi:hypothetical protein
MLRLFLGLTTANLTALMIAAALGYLHVWSPAAAGGVGGGGGHILTGALATGICVGVHCVVFTYFIATAKWAQHAVSVKGLDPAMALPTRTYRAQAFPAALAAIVSVFIAAIFGVLLDAQYDLPRTWHHLLALAAIAVNLAAAVVEYRAIYRNGQLIDQILQRVNATK